MNMGSEGIPLFPFFLLLVTVLLVGDLDTQPLALEKLGMLEWRACPGSYIFLDMRGFRGLPARSGQVLSRGRDLLAT